MTSVFPGVLTQTKAIQEHVDHAVNDLITKLPSIEQLSAEDRRGIIARYAAVLEGNFIYWMTGTYLSVQSEEARSIILANLREEVRDCHPGMLRRFAMAAQAVPTDVDTLAVYHSLSSVRLFVGQLSPMRSLAMMAFFEGFIQRFMPYLGELAQRQGSTDMEYTDVHGVCDIAHAQELYYALEAEVPTSCEMGEDARLFEGVDLLHSLIENIIHA